MIQARRAALTAVLFSALVIAGRVCAYAYETNFGPGFATRPVNVDGVTVSVNVGGHGPVVLLLHGYAEDARMWRPLAKELASRFTVIAPDLPGIGNSSIPSGGIDMTTSAVRIHDAVHKLGFSKASVVGHDIGLMVAYAYAAKYGSEVNRLALLDAFLPGIAGWEPIYDSPDFWHFRFYGPTPLALVTDRENIYFAYFWNDLAYDKNRSIPQADRAGYLAAYSRPGRMAAGWAYFKSFPKTATEFAAFGKTKLTMPLLTMGGDKSLGVALGEQGHAVATNVQVIVLKNCGHWIMEEQPRESMNALRKFLEQ